MKFKGKTALVTGASSGIGRHTALLLGRMGARVAVTARRAEKLEELCRELDPSGESSLAIPVDMMDEQAPSQIKQRLDERWGAVDVLVLNAGCYCQGRILSTGLDEFQRSMEINYYSHLRIIKTFTPSMIEHGGGHIGIVSSLDAKKGIVGDGPYVAAKCALSGTADVLRQELKADNVFVSTMFPGRVDTPMIEHIEAPLSSPKAAPEKVARALLRGMARNQPEIIVPRVYAPLMHLNAVYPGLMDHLYRWFNVECRPTSQ